MKITEIDFEEEGTVYETNKNMWIIDNGELKDLDNHQNITEMLLLSSILKLDFEKVDSVLWNEVEDGTRVLVKDYIEDNWEEAHFSDYFGKEVHVYADGKSAWTGSKHEIETYRYIILAD